MIPVTRRLLADDETPVGVYRKLAGDRPGTFLFESAENGRSWSRWSFVGRPQRGRADRGGRRADLDRRGARSGCRARGDPLAALRTVVEELHSERLPGLPPLTGGMVGYLGYDVVRRLERLPELAVDDLRIPELVMLLATDLAAVDHHEGTITLIANAINWDATDERVDEAYDDAVARLDRMTAELAAPAPSTVAVYRPAEPRVHPPPQPGRAPRRGRGGQGADPRGRGVPGGGLAAVRDGLRRPTRSTSTGCCGPPTRARTCTCCGWSPRPTAQRFDIVGSSPEALVTVRDGQATTHPIAGTRWRGATEEEDLLLEKELRTDEKERAEHVMLVDLGRNDLGRVCEPGTVKVHSFFSVERYSHVMHLVSTVTGTLRADRNAFDAVAACFPAGTLSGAPKPRAMEIIEELEPTRRGLYGGIVGYLDFAGDADTAIAIRTALVRDGVAYVQAGGGIVADSDPVAEDTECLNKARAVLSAVATAATLAQPRRCRRRRASRDGRDAASGRRGCARDRRRAARWRRRALRWAPAALPGSVAGSGGLAVG